MAKDTKYNGVLQELKRDFNSLIYAYLQELHNAFHEDNGLEVSHKAIVNKIERDFKSICSINLGSIAFDDRSEEQVIKEILEYNYDQADIKHMKEVEKIDLYSQLDMLSKNCIKRSESEWFQYGIHELLQNGKVDPGAIGSRRTQFCKCCGEQIYISPEYLQSRNHPN